MLKKYKGNRDNLVKPPYYTELREYLTEKYGALTYYKFEADDMACMAMEKANASGDVQAILAAIDKDLEQQAGRHINPNKKAEGVYVVDDFTGAYSFYKQMLMGDVADNIPGLPRIGDKTAVKILENCKTIHDLFITTFKMYQKKLGDGYLATPWWWDENKMHDKDGELVAKYWDEDYFDAELCIAKRVMYPEHTVQMTVEDVFYENADLLYMLRTPDDQYVAPVQAKDKFTVREPYPKGIVIAMLGEDDGNSK
jgi:5'-3' exonuclease